MKIPWDLAVVLMCAILTSWTPSVDTFLFRRKYIHHLVNDPYQVKPDNITLDNLFGWLNMKNHIKFKLWTRKNPKWAHEIRIGDVESLRTSNFDVRRLTKVIVHGYAHSANEIYLEDWMVSLRDAYMHLADLNILIIDYTLFALPMFYWSAAPDLAAEQLTEMIKFLVQNGVQLETLHMLGFSWGAHVAGIAGWLLGGKIGRITGLDPAQPTFRLVDDSKRLDKSDALFVDIIHTNGGRAFMEGHLGLGNPLGHADYYPNSGRAQPGCPKKWTYIYEEIECDHARSVAFFAESIVSPVAFPACRCDKWDNFVKGVCSCGPEDMVFMGEHSPHSTSGKYYLFTKDKKPYGLGTPLYISLPDIDKYDPDWNNTGFHHHVLPFARQKQEEEQRQMYNVAPVQLPFQKPYYSPSFNPQPHNNEYRQQQTLPVAEGQWQDVGSMLIKADPVHEYSYYEPSNEIAKRESPSNHQNFTIASHSNDSSIDLPKSLPETLIRFSKELLSKYVDESNRQSRTI